MAKPVSKPTPAPAASPGNSPAVAVNGAPQPAAPSAPAPSAAITAAKHGGLRGGRPRGDGLVPGSPEALEADRKADALRKKQERAEKRAEDPPPIPPAQGPAATPGNGVALVPGAQSPSFVAWDPKSLEPLFGQIIPTVEQLMANQLVTRAKRAHLPNENISDIQKAAAWNPAAKKALEISSAQVAAKYMNKTGLSAEYQPEVVLVTAVAAITAQQMQVLSRLDELIKKVNVPIEEIKP